MRACRLVLIVALVWLAMPGTAVAQDAPKRDSIWNGVLIGAAIGAAPGVYWKIKDPNECTGLCPEEYGLIAVGAVVGGLIDRAVHKKVSKSVSIGPQLRRNRWGFRVALRF